MYFAEHNVEGLLRGDSTNRADFYSKALADKWMTVDEVRKLENLPKIDHAKQDQAAPAKPAEDEAGPGQVPGADIALYLARHGIKVSVASRAEKSIGVGEIILSDAADDGSDLIVMGSYGHSRIRELMLGGATRTMLGSMTVPVLMAH